MPSEPSQSGRIAQLKTPIDGDRLVLSRFDGDEGLSELFEYRVEALSPQQNIDFSQSLGRACTVSVQSYNGAERHFNGVLVEAQWVGVQQSLNAYRLVLRPWLWLLSRRSDCRIFKNMNVVKIIREVFDKAGFADYKVLASEGDFSEIEYCVQYRESDLAFISRLMEEFGLYTYHLHSKDRHELVLANSKSCHRKVGGPASSLNYISLTDKNRRTAEHIYHWVTERKFRTGKFALNDYDYMRPTANLKSNSQGAESYEKSSFENYDYPGRYRAKDQGEDFAKIKLEAEQALDHRKHAAGDAVSLFPGGLFSLSRHPTDDAEYLIVRATHAFVSEDYASGGGAQADEVYHGHYELLRSNIPFRAPILTPKPLIRGPQTGIVVARDKFSGEEIDVDEEGRIFVQFHWNRDKAAISRPVRVAQMCSGKSWGWQFIPRVGQEVVIEFLEGDPDQPLVVGTVYNKDYPFPYSLPDNKTISGLKTDSSKGHGGYNEFHFEDKKNEENIKFRAEKDHDSIIRHAETRVIGETFETPVGSPARSTSLKNGDEVLKVESGNWDGDVAQNIHFKAGMQIIFEVGGSKITMTPATIKIEAGQIELSGVAEILQKALLIRIN